MPKSVIELIEDRFGVVTTSRDNAENTSIGVASLLIARQNPNRLALVVINLSPNNIFLRPRQDATTSIGIRLNANGGSVSITMEFDFLLPTFDWFAIASAAASSIYVLETLVAPG